MPVPVFSVNEVLTSSAMNQVGLWKVASGTLSLSTTPTNVTGVFSSTYKNYRVVLNTTARSTLLRIEMKYINGTTPTSTSYYQGGIGADWGANTVIYFQRSNNDAQFFGLTSNAPTVMTVDIFNPNRSNYTTHTGHFFDVMNAYSYSIGGVQNSTNQFTGFQLYTSTGTATLEYQVFGYRD